MILLLINKCIGVTLQSSHIYCFFYCRNLFMFFCTYLRLWIHFKDWDNGSFTTALNVSDSNTLFKTRLYTYSPFWSQLSPQAPRDRRDVSSRPNERNTSNRIQAAENSETARCLTVAWNFIQREIEMCVCMYVCDFSQTTGHEIFPLFFFKAVKGWHKGTEKEPRFKTQLVWGSLYGVCMFLLWLHGFPPTV